MTIPEEYGGQGRAIEGGHVIERFARGDQVPEQQVRAAVVAPPVGVYNGHVDSMAWGSAEARRRWRDAGPSYSWSPVIEERPTHLGSPNIGAIT